MILLIPIITYCLILFLVMEFSLGVGYVISLILPLPLFQSTIIKEEDDNMLAGCDGCQQIVKVEVKTINAKEWNHLPGYRRYDRLADQEPVRGGKRLCITSFSYPQRHPRTGPMG